MKKAPRENFWWGFLHNCVVHPVMFVCRYPQWAERIHDWTAKRAWPGT
jgi:uncharacterized membrane protein YhaH (DUF805 family)